LALFTVVGVLMIEILLLGLATTVFLKLLGLSLDLAFKAEEIKINYGED